MIFGGIYYLCNMCGRVSACTTWQVKFFKVTPLSPGEQFFFENILSDWIRFWTSKGESALS